MILQFTTVVGDSVDAPPYELQPSLKSSLRAMRTSRGTAKSYEWIPPNAELDTEGNDIRDTLEKVAEMAEQGVWAPWPQWAVPFEQTAEAFVEARGLLKNGGVVVSRLM
jgi:hypothetical protein